MTSDFATSADNWTISYPNAPWSTLNNTWFDLTPVYALQTEARDFARLEWKECLDRYVNPFQATSSVIVVTADLSTTQNAGSSLIDAWISAYDSINGNMNWLCTSYAYTSPSGWKYCTVEWSETVVDEWLIGYGPKRVVDHCLVSTEADNNQRCGLHYSGPVVGLVLALTLVQSMMMFWVSLSTWRDGCAKIKKNRLPQQTMLTIGDAIGNFLANPDYLLSDVSDTTHSQTGTSRVVFKAEIWEVKRRIVWFSAVATSGWIISLSL